MIRNLVCAAVLASLALTPLACNDAPGQKVVKASPSSSTKAPADIGPALYPKKSLPPDEQRTQVVDPVSLPAHLTVTQKVDIPSQREGKIMMIGTELQQGEQGKYDKDSIYTHFDPIIAAKDPNARVAVRPLVPGNRVEKGRLVVILDDQEAIFEYLSRVAAREAAKFDVAAATATHKLTIKQKEQTEYLFKNGNTVSQFEVDKANLDVERAKAELEKKTADEVKAKSELDRARVLLQYHHIRAPISGILQPTNRKAGEGIRAQETLFQIQNTDLLRAEGTVPMGNSYRVKTGMEVVIEPSREKSPLKIIPASEQRINGIAFSHHPEPRIVVASEDKAAKVYTLKADPPTVLWHGMPVRSVACAKSASTQTCLTGAEDGVGRLWDLDAKNATPRLLDGFKHKGPVTAVAFSPDAKFCATADNRDICLWDVVSGKLKYTFPGNHLGEIQSLTFTPQARMVSAARDNTLAVWTLGEKGASLDYAISGRTGEIAQLGVSHSGKFALFDIGQSLRITAIATRETVAELRSITDAYKFATFALCSPDDKMILTGTNNESRLTVWKAPTASTRATELRQFVPTKRVTMTCAAISPSEKYPLAISGTKEGDVLVWPMPTESEISAPIKGKITFVDLNADATGRNYRVWAEFDNTKAQLSPGEAVTLVIYEQQPATGK